jgi:hypothetical protein
LLSEWPEKSHAFYEQHVLKTISSKLAFFKIFLSSISASLPILNSILLKKFPVISPRHYDNLQLKIMMRLGSLKCSNADCRKLQKDVQKMVSIRKEKNAAVVEFVPAQLCCEKVQESITSAINAVI